MSFFPEIDLYKKPALPEMREVIAEKFVAYLNKGVFDASDHEQAEKILRLFVSDSNMRVRRVLAEQLCRNPHIPHDVAILLAQDELVVSLQMLEFSPVLVTEDLLEIVNNSQEISRLMAVSRRNGLPQEVSHALIDTDNEEVIIALLQNHTASIFDTDLLRLLDVYDATNNIYTVLVDRKGLSKKIVDKMLVTLSGSLRERFIERNSISIDYADAFLSESQRQVTLGVEQEEPVENPLSEQYEAVKELRNQVSNLYEKHMLSSSLVIRSICQGNLAFFEMALSKLAGVRYANVCTLIREENPKAFAKLYHAANLPPSLLDAVAVILGFCVKEDKKGIPVDNNFRQRLIEFIEAEEYENSIDLMPYVMNLIMSDVTVADVMVSH